MILYDHWHSYSIQMYLVRIKASSFQIYSIFKSHRPWRHAYTRAGPIIICPARLVIFLQNASLVINFTESCNNLSSHSLSKILSFFTSYCVSLAVFVLVINVTLILTKHLMVYQIHTINLKNMNRHTDAWSAPCRQDCMIGRTAAICYTLNQLTKCHEEGKFFFISPKIL